MAITREQLIEAVMRAFGAAESAAVLDTLDQYGIAAHEPERERVQLTLVKLAAGDRNALARLVRVAKQDYRDVLCWADSGPLSTEDGERLQSAARHLIDRWGDK